MKQEFIITPIRSVSANGTLEAIGWEWTEEASLRHSNRALMWFAFILLLFMLPLGLAFIALSALLGIIATALIAWTAFYCLRWQLGALPRRSVVFLRDGTISVPHGLPGHGSARRMRRTQPHVGNIEIGPCRSGMQQDWTSTVKLVAGIGKTDTISQKLHQEEAREVVVALTMALQEMRLSVGREPVRHERTPVAARRLVE